MAARLLLAALVFSTVACDGETTRPLPAETVGSEREILDAGAVRLLIDNRGGIARSSADLESVASFPAGSPNEYLFSAGLWIGGVVRGQAVVATTAEHAPFASEFLPGRRSGQRIGGSRILCSSRPADLDRWYPEFRDGGDVPLLLGDEDCVAIFHDGNPVRDVHAPIGIEVRQRAAAFRTGLEAHAIVFVWDFEVAGLEPVTDAHAAVFVDADIGADFSDDRCSAVLEVPSGANNPQSEPVQANLFFCWDQDFAEDTFDQNPPGFFGVSFLHSPAETGARRLSRATETGNSFAGGLPNDPETDGSQHELMAGRFTWGPSFIGHSRHARGLAVAGPFTLEPHEPQRLVAAFVWANASTPVASLAVSAERCFPEGRPCFLPDPNDPAMAELIAVQQAVQERIGSRLAPS
jgi:hypothetical protein